MGRQSARNGLDTAAVNACDQLLYQRPRLFDYRFEAAGGDFGPVGNVCIGFVSAAGVGCPRWQVADIVGREMR